MGTGYLSYRSPIKIASDLLWDRLTQLARDYASGKLVDIGCGTKPYETLFAPFVDSYFGVDAEGMRDVHYGAATRADLYTDCTNTGLESESFNTLLSTQVMEHVFDTEGYLRECSRLLKVGGMGIFTIPFVWQTHAEPYDFYRFTPYSISRLFESKGFEIVKLEPIGGAYATLMQTKLISIYCRPSTNLAYKIFRTIRNAIMIPLSNYLALHLDRFIQNDKLCLNYAVVVRKLGR